MSGRAGWRTVTPMRHDVVLYQGEALGRYGFGGGHPFGPDRLSAFLTELARQGLDRTVKAAASVAATDEALSWFHDAAYVRRVRLQSLSGGGFLDQGDTPAVPGIFDAASHVVGSVVAGAALLLRGEASRVFVPIAGLHHARRTSAGGFCVFNDIGVLIEALKRQGLTRIAYVDIDAHHGDGVYYDFEDDPCVFSADIHEDGRFLYPGTGGRDESGRDAGAGRKLNIPLAPGAGDREFLAAFDEVETFVRAARPEIILLQAGADSIAGDPLAHLALTPEAHRHATKRLCALAGEYAQGRVLAMGGGGYNRDNLAATWTGVVRELLADR